jgi:Kef-type K+ transport system membrane component KefB
MSGAADAPASALDRLVAMGRGLAALGLLVGALVALRLLGWDARTGGPLFALGFLLIAGTVGGRVAAFVGMPRLTGYLATGVLAGPHGFALFGRAEVESLTLVNGLALALIALQAGAELTVPMLRRSFKSLVAASVAHIVIITGGMVGVFFLLSRWMDFTESLSTTAVLALAGVWGAMAVSKAPADTLAILGETRSSGPVSEHALGVVVLLDVFVLVLFALAMMVARATFDPAADGVTLHAFAVLAEEIGASVAAGTTFGLVIALWFWLVKREKLLFTVVVAYGVTAFCAYFHYDTLLVFVVAGFVVMNLTRFGHDLIETTESAGAAVMVVFFATAGAQLDIGALKTAGGIAAGLAFGRIFFTWLACQLGHWLAKDPTTVRRYAFTSFISQAGVTIGLAAIARDQLGAPGAGMATLVIAVIGINELIGPVAFKLGLTRAGETGRGLDLDHNGLPDESERHGDGSDAGAPTAAQAPEEVAESAK